MIDRYINNKINAIWNDQNKFDTWKLIQEKYVETLEPVSYTHLRAHETEADVVCRVMV